MKKLIFIILLFIGVGVFAQDPTSPIGFGPIEIKLKNPGIFMYQVSRVLGDTLTQGFGATHVFTFTNRQGDICFNINGGTIKCISQIGAGTYTGGTGISISGTTITNTSPGQIYSAGDGINISGTTISNTSQGTLYAAGTGLLLTGTTFSATQGALSGNGTSVWLTPPYVKLGIGTSNPTYSLSFDAQTMPVWGAERNLTNNTKGTGLTISAGGAKSGALNTGSEPLIFEAPYTTGNSSTSTKFQGRKRSTTSGTTDNAAFDQFVLLGRDKITNNVEDTIYSIEIDEDSVYTALLSYSLLIRNATTDVIQSGLFQVAALRSSGVWGGSFAVLVMNSQLFGSTLTTTPLIRIKHSPRRAYFCITYNSNLSSITMMGISCSILQASGGKTNVTQY
jgi:hypothetical protein